MMDIDPDYTADDLRFDPVKIRMVNRTIRSQGWSDRWDLKTGEMDDTVFSALETLNENNILSIPVTDDFAGYRGFVDMLQLVSHVIEEVSDLTRGDLFTDEYWRAKTRIRNTKLRTFIWQNEQPPSIFAGASLFQAMESMALTDSHRLAITNYSGDVTGILTQSDMIGWVFSQLKSIPDAASVQVHEIRPYNWILTVRDTISARRAFEIMARKKVNGLAVVNVDGRLTDCLSVRDLRGIGPGTSQFSKLWDNVATFKMGVRSRFPGLEKKWGGYCLRTDTLEDVVRKMTNLKIHRIFVVDSYSTMRPIDVISQTDVLKFVHSNARSTW
jgi:CBS domain-containing protein